MPVHAGRAALDVGAPRFEFGLTAKRRINRKPLQASCSRFWPAAIQCGALDSGGPTASRCRYAGKQVLLDNCVNAPIAIDHLRDAEVYPDGHERNRLVLA